MQARITLLTCLFVTVAFAGCTSATASLSLDTINGSETRAETGFECEDEPDEIEIEVEGEGTGSVEVWVTDADGNDVHRATYTAEDDGELEGEWEFEFEDDEQTAEASTEGWTVHMDASNFDGEVELELDC